MPTQASILSHSCAPSTPRAGQTGKESENAAGEKADTFGGKQCDPLHSIYRIEPIAFMFRYRNHGHDDRFRSLFAIPGGRNGSLRLTTHLERTFYPLRISKLLEPMKEL